MKTALSVESSLLRTRMAFMARIIPLYESAIYILDDDLSCIKDLPVDREDGVLDDICDAISSLSRLDPVLIDAKYLNNADYLSRFESILRLYAIRHHKFVVDLENQACTGMYNDELRIDYDNLERFISTLCKQLETYRLEYFVLSEMSTIVRERLCNEAKCGKYSHPSYMSLIDSLFDVERINEKEYARYTPIVNQACVA